MHTHPEPLPVNTHWRKRGQTFLGHFNVFATRSNRVTYLYTCFSLNGGIRRRHLFTSNSMDCDGDTLSEEDCFNSSAFKGSCLLVYSIFHNSNSLLSSFSFMSKRRISIFSSLNQSISSACSFPTGELILGAPWSRGKTPLSDIPDHNSDFITCFPALISNNNQMLFCETMEFIKTGLPHNLFKITLHYPEQVSNKYRPQ